MRRGTLPIDEVLRDAAEICVAHSQIVIEDSMPCISDATLKMIANTTGGITHIYGTSDRYRPYEDAVFVVISQDQRRILVDTLRKFSKSIKFTSPIYIAVRLDADETLADLVAKKHHGRMVIGTF
jgi:hypothetical protein